MVTSRGLCLPDMDILRARAMSAEILNTSGSALTVKFSGRVTYPEFTAGQQAVARFIRGRPDKVRILAILDNFLGWAPEGDWGDTAWLDEFDPRIDRIAVVGDRKWKEQVEFFTLKGLRKALVEYFEPNESERALAWLKAQPPANN